MGDEELLYLAVVRRNTPAVRSLLKRGADARGRHSGRSILEHAMHPQADPEMIRLLQEHGADITNARSFSGEPLFWRR